VRRLASKDAAIGQSRRTEAKCWKAIELKPTSAEAYIQLGDLYKAQGRTEETIALYRAAARKNPGAAWPHIELGKVYLGEARRDETD
jgi:tetratricopeptide (TPR) repeat protein